MAPSHECVSAAYTAEGAASAMAERPELHPAEIRLLLLIRQIGHGELHLKIADGYAVLAEEVVKNHKLI